MKIKFNVLFWCRLYNSGNSSKEEQLENGEHAEESVIHDITGTTVYVVGVICVIPAAGLVAWVVRYVVKKKVRPFYFGISIVFNNIFIKLLTNHKQEKIFAI